MGDIPKPPWLTQFCAWLNLGTETTRAVDVPMPAAPLGWRQPRESKEDVFFFDTRGWSNEKLQIAILY